MLDTNTFKRSVKEWVRNNPAADELQFLDFCEEQIPPQHYSANRWLIDQSVSWFRFILAERENKMRLDDDY